MHPNSFFHRVVLLLGLMAAVAGWDIFRNRGNAVKFREYGFILITGALGALAGFINDLITSGISPDYFILGKGLEDAPGLRLQAGLYGVQAGFSAGVVGGALCLFIARKKSSHPPATFTRLLQLLWIPVAGAILGGWLFPTAFSRFDPARFEMQLNSMLSAGKITRFKQVWWTHLGLYAGMAVGLAAMVFRASKERKTAAQNS